MIKVLKLQKAVFAFILGVLALVGYKITNAHKMGVSIYFLEAAGLFFILGAGMFLYPILFAKKDKEGNVELDSEIANTKEGETIDAP